MSVSTIMEQLGGNNASSTIDSAYGKHTHCLIWSELLSLIQQWKLYMRTVSMLLRPCSTCFQQKKQHTSYIKIAIKRQVNER